MLFHKFVALIFLLLLIFIFVGVPYFFLFGGAQKFLLGTLRRKFKGLKLRNRPQKGDVKAIYHTYRGLLVWFIQDEHIIYGPKYDVQVLLGRLLKFNLTFGLLCPAAIFIPFLATLNYYSQLRSIHKQQSRNKGRKRKNSSA